MGFNCLKATEPLKWNSFFFASKFLGVTGTHLIYLRRIKGQYILSYFFKTLRALFLSRNFAQFFLKLMSPRLGIVFEIYAV